MADGALEEIATKISESQILKDYQEAFSRATGLPLTFQAAGRRRPALRGNPFANKFCQLMVASAPGCRLCMEMQERLCGDGHPTDPAHASPHPCACANGSDSRSATCLAGLTDSAVPVKVGNETLGYLQTGQVALKDLTRQDFKRVAKWLQSWNSDSALPELETAFFETRRLDTAQFDAMLRLLSVFSQHLSLAAEQLAVQIESREPPMIRRARQFIESHQQDEISLKEVARAVNTSTYYFCKMFKKATGMTFTQNLSFVRIGQAKKMLLNPHLRVSEIAFQIGFKSLTHFNRVFKQCTGQTPSDYRAALPRIA
jgi:AraC-like DNA-binding protein